MSDRLRRPFFIVAIVLIVLVVIVEAGSSLFPAAPGLAIGYLVLIDGLLLLRVAIMAFAWLLSDRLVSKIQGVVTLLIGILVVLGGIVLTLAALAKLLLMLALLLAVPFGTAAYFATYATFDRTTAALLLSLLLALKLGFGLCLVLAHQDYLQHKGLVLLIATSLVANLVISFLHGLVPRPLVSITDAVAAIVVGVIAIIWALVIAIMSIPSVVNVLRAALKRSS